MADNKKTPTSKPAAKRASKSSSTTKKSTSKGSKKTVKTTVKRSFMRKTWSVFWKFSLAVFIAMAMYFIYLDSKTTRIFEGNKWQLPAQVYARSMEFYPGQFLSSQEVVFELERLHYSSVNRLSRTGQFVKRFIAVILNFMMALKNHILLNFVLQGEKLRLLKISSAGV